MVDTVQIHLFYPLLFLLLISIVITIGIIIAKSSDNGLFSNIFNKHTAEHIDTTDKFSKAHTEVIEHLPPVYEKELHALEKNNKKIMDILEDISDKLNMLIEHLAYNKK